MDKEYAEIKQDLLLLTQEVSYVKSDVKEIKNSLAKLVDTLEGVRKTIDVINTKVMRLEMQVQMQDEELRELKIVVEENKNFRVKLVGIAVGVSATTGGVIASIINFLR